MKEQKQRLMLGRPAKSLSARSFSKMGVKDKSQRKYHNTLHTEPIDSSHLKRTVTSRLEGRSRQVTVRVREMGSLVPEEMQEENMKLKGKVNRLNEQLVLERVKRTQDTKHLNKMQREVQAQFQDDRYLDVSRTQSKLIEGVKHQYQKMKQKYEEKSHEYIDLLKRYEISGGEEAKFECEGLHAENRRLKQKMETLLSTEERISFQYERVRKRDSREYEKMDEGRILDMLGYSAKIENLVSRNENLGKLNARYQRKLQKLNKILQERTHKIKFLDKLLIEKSNENHHLVMKQRKTAKENKALTVDLEDIQVKLERETEARKLDLEYLKERERVKFQTEKTIFVRSLCEKDRRIEKLSDELRYVSTLIQYLKVGDEQLEGLQNGGTSGFSPMGKKASNRQKSEQILHNLQMQLTSLNQPQIMRQRVKSLFSVNLPETSNAKGLRESNFRLQANTETLKQLQMSSEDEDIVVSVKGSPRSSAQNDSDQLQTRVVKKSYLKHHVNSFGMRHVKMWQLQEFQLDLMYRFIYYGLEASQAKKLLSFNEEERKGVSKKEARWREKYISMREAKEKMMRHPFELSETQATLLARYMVEDATREEVFFHEDNEVQRAIAQSILRAFIGEYVLPDSQEAQTEISTVLSSKGKNLHSALSSLAPSGTISWTKLQQISSSIHVCFTEQTWNYIFSQLNYQSEGGMGQLRYGLLFQQL